MLARNSARAVVAPEAVAPHCRATRNVRSPTIATLHRKLGVALALSLLPPRVQTLVSVLPLPNLAHTSRA